MNTKATARMNADTSSLEEVQSFPHANDWIGLFESGTCMSDWKGKHQCYIATRSIPKPRADPSSWSGQVCFELEEYRHSGSFDVRYFYGDDPMIDRNCSTPEFAGNGVVEGCASPHFHWNGNGYVCNTHA